MKKVAKGKKVAERKKRVQESPRCSFCNVSADEKVLISAPPLDNPKAYICGDCLHIASHIFAVGVIEKRKNGSL